MNGNETVFHLEKGGNSGSGATSCKVVISSRFDFQVCHSIFHTFSDTAYSMHNDNCANFVFFFFYVKNREKKNIKTNIQVAIPDRFSGDRIRINQKVKL
jgi:hypothetical protein